MTTTHKGQMVHATIMQTFAHIVFELFANTAGEHRFLDRRAGLVQR